jgi:hypothetical protein
VWQMRSNDRADLSQFSERRVDRREDRSSPEFARVSGVLRSDAGSQGYALSERPWRRPPEFAGIVRGRSVSRLSGVEDYSVTHEIIRCYILIVQVASRICRLGMPIQPRPAP